MSFRPRKISKEDFSEWKQNPITEALYADLIASVLEQYDDSLPSNSVEGMPAAYRRDGAREVLEIVFEWKPEFEESDND